MCVCVCVCGGGGGGGVVGGADLIFCVNLKVILQSCFK